MIRRLALSAALLVACGDDPITAPDAGGADAASGMDAGVRALCPMLAAPACTKSLDCMPPPSPASPAMCPTCRPYHSTACVFGACLPLQDRTPLVTAYVNIEQVRTSIRSFVLTVVAGETAGGLELSCQDLTSGRVNPDDPCVTLVDSRTFTLAELNPTGFIYGPYSSNYPTTTRNLFLVRGYDDTLGRGNAVGVACAEAAAGIMPVPPASRVEIDLGSLTR